VRCYSQLLRKQTATSAADVADGRGGDLAEAREGVVVRSVSASGPVSVRRWTLRSRRGLAVWLPSVKLCSAERSSADCAERRIELFRSS
jgi:hypothetical protein